MNRVFHRALADAKIGNFRWHDLCSHICEENRHATKHFRATHHPIIEGYDPPEGWGWCYVDQVTSDLSDRATPHNGPIPRYV